MNPFWTWLIDFFPLWIAPNTITLVGFIYMLAATAWAAYENPSFHGDLTTVRAWRRLAARASLSLGAGLRALRYLVGFCVPGLALARLHVRTLILFF